MSVSCYLSGRWGNIIFHLSQMIAYAKKHGLTYYVPNKALAYKDFRDGDITNPIQLKSTGEEPFEPFEYYEPNQSSGNPYYHEIPKMDNVKFCGYFQSFLFFDWCRDYILDTFNFPYKMEKGVTSISVRRGDCLNSPNFPIAPKEYYENAIKHMIERGFNNFRLYSDDQEWCKEEFTEQNYPNANFQFSNGSEAKDFVGISQCEHNITARSTFSLTSAWFNKNPDKIVLVPQKDLWWKGQNLDLIPDYFTQIKFDDYGNSLR